MKALNDALVQTDPSSHEFYSHFLGEFASYILLTLAMFL